MEAVLTALIFFYMNIHNDDTLLKVQIYNIPIMHWNTAKVER